MAAPKGSLWVRAQRGLPPLLLLTMALAGGSGTASAEAFDSILGDTASCHRACQLTFPLHTYPKVGPVRTGLHPPLAAHLSLLPDRCQPWEPGCRTHTLQPLSPTCVAPVVFPRSPRTPFLL